MSQSESDTKPQDCNSTFAWSGSLPRVPLPGLGETSDRFMEWCSPLLTPAERDETRQAVEEFTRPGGLGEKLQAALKRFDETPGTHSWLDKFWPSRYLGRRDPIALNANFFFLFRHQKMSRSERAAGLVAAALNYKLTLDREAIPVAMNRQIPLCMDQVKYLFSATRIPGAKQDGLRSFYSDEMPGPSSARHIIVFHHGMIFALDIISNKGVPHSLHDIHKGINAICEGKQTGQRIGHLTTMRRADWAGVRETMRGLSTANASALDLIETALFSISLEDHEPSGDLAACDQLLHGDSSNRWYDKALQFIVFGNGMAGINIEHCMLDGTTVINFIDTILEMDLSGIDACSGAAGQGTPDCEALVFDLNAALKTKIADAGEDFNKLRTTTATRLFDFPDFGGKLIKNLRMSPDAFAQCSMQLAHVRSKGFIGATYESIATRHFEHGRTEAMRTVTPEVQTFVNVMIDDSTSDTEKIAALRAAGDKHVSRAKACQQGQAPEQHLWELLNIHNRGPEALQSGADANKSKGSLTQKDIDKALQLYESPGWLKMRSDALSTSSAPSRSALYFGFGSTGPGCIGLGYLVRPEEIICYLSTAQGEEQALERFMTHWRTALRELAELLKQDPALS